MVADYTSKSQIYQVYSAWTLPAITDIQTLGGIQLSFIKLMVNWNCLRIKRVLLNWDSASELDVCRLANVPVYYAQVVNETSCTLISCSLCINEKMSLGSVQFLTVYFKMYFLPSYLTSNKTFSVTFSFWLPASVLIRNLNPIHS